MRRKAFIGALLLPLPFAALPVLAVLMGGFASSSTNDALLQAPAPIQDAPVDQPHQGSALAYGVTEPTYDDCSRDTVSNIES
jgi:hypothetical protein